MTNGQDNYHSRPEDRVRESSRTMFEQENDRRIAELSSQVSMLKEVRAASGACCMCVFCVSGWWTSVIQSITVCVYAPTTGRADRLTTTQRTTRLYPHHS